MNDLFAIAKRVQAKSDIRRHRMSAIAIFRGGRWVAASNRLGSGKSSAFSLHAEELLIRKLVRLRAKERWGLPEIYVLRIRKDGNIGSSKPCNSCARQLAQLGYSRVFFF